jgi:hypothetical protein
MALQIEGAGGHAEPEQGKADGERGGSPHRCMHGVTPGDRGGGSVAPHRPAVNSAAGPAAKLATGPANGSARDNARPLHATCHPFRYPDERT